MHRGHLREEAALAAVGALVEHERALPRDERAVALGAGLELDHHALAAMVDRDELLAAGEDELDRPACGTSQGRDMALEVEVALGAEAAAEQRDDDAHVRLGDLKRVRDTATGRVRHLSGRPDRHLVAVPLGDDRPRLDGSALRAVGDVTALHDDVRRRHRSVGIALDDGRVADPVAVATHRVVALVRLPVVVNERDTLGSRRCEIGNRRKGLVVDLDQSCRFLGQLGRQGRDSRDDVAFPDDLVLREQPPVLHHAAVLDVGYVLVRQHGQHARKRPRLGGVDARDAGVRVIRVPELRVQLSGEVQIGRIAAEAGDLLLAVGPDERLLCRTWLLDRRHCRASFVEFCAGDGTARRRGGARSAGRSPTYDRATAARAAQ